MATSTRSRVPEVDGERIDRLVAELEDAFGLDGRHSDPRGPRDSALRYLVQEWQRHDPKLDHSYWSGIGGLIADDTVIAENGFRSALIALVDAADHAMLEGKDVDYSTVLTMECAYAELGRIIDAWKASING
jgi:hypothetical protein